MIVIALLLDEVIQEVAIFFTDILSQGQGTRRTLSLSDPISSWRHGKSHVAYKSENRSYKEEFMPRFHQRKRHCAKEENNRRRSVTCLCLPLLIARTLVLTIPKLTIKFFIAMYQKSTSSQRKRMPRL